MQNINCAGHFKATTRLGNVRSLTAARARRFSGYLRFKALRIANSVTSVVNIRYDSSLYIFTGTHNAGAVCNSSSSVHDRSRSARSQAGTLTHLSHTLVTHEGAGDSPTAYNGFRVIGLASGANGTPSSSSLMKAAAKSALNFSLSLA